MPCCLVKGCALLMGQKLRGVLHPDDPGVVEPGRAGEDRESTPPPAVEEGACLCSIASWFAVTVKFDDAFDHRVCAVYELDAPHAASRCMPGVLGRGGG